MNRMNYGVCTRCSHTASLLYEPRKDAKRIYQRCYNCGVGRIFRIVRQIELPDGSVEEITG